MPRWLPILLALLLLVPGCLQGSPDGDDGGGDTPPLAWPTRMTALGDSITRAYAVVATGSGFPRDAPERSWATGTFPESHASRFVATGALPRGMVYNDAQSGARMAGLAAQVTQAIAKRADYVTILMGSNDICGARSLSETTPVAQFETQFRNALEALNGSLATLPKARAFVASIPNLTHLREVYGEDPRARGAWDTFGICPAVLAADRTSAELAAVDARVRAYNEVLQRVCEAYPWCGHDSGAVYATAFTQEAVSTVDFFHPSAAGQRQLANLTWARMQPPT